MPAVAFVLQRMQIADVGVDLFFGKKVCTVLTSLVSAPNLNDLDVCAF